MATQKKPKLDENISAEGKRPLSESDSEGGTTFSTFTSSIHFPNFIVIESKDPSHPITKLSPFVVEKQLLSILGTPKSVKKLRNDTILVECFTKQQAENLLKHKKFFQTDVKIYPHKALNSCKGVVRCKELSLCSITEIQSNLKSQGVTEVRRISVRRNGEMRTTHTYILTFSSSNLPQSVKIGYMNVNVDMYIPNPLRCFKCQKYGHHISKCPGNPVCAKCGKEDENHDFETCSGPLKCSNCKGAHATFSRECPIWKEEKEILNLKYTKKLSFPEARQQIKQRKADQSKFSFSASYANVTTPAQENCHTCVILAKLILEKFPEIKNDLKEILPKQTFAALSPPAYSSNASTVHPAPSSSSKSSPVPIASTSSETNLKNGSSSLVNQKSNKQKPLAKSNQDVQKTPPRPKARVRLTKNTPSASTDKEKTNSTDEEEVFETRVSDSEVSQLVDTAKSARGKKKNRRARERKITVKIGNPSVELSNRYEMLENTTDETNAENTNKDEEKMEEESDGSECDSTWAIHRSDWTKDIQSWQTSTAETRCFKDS